MNQFTCLGCGKGLKNLDKYEVHAKKCKKLAKVVQLSYNIPTVNTEDLAQLEPKLLPNSKDWGIWNGKANDWVRDKGGQIDSRVFKYNVDEFLSCIIAASMIGKAHH